MAYLIRQVSRTADGRDIVRDRRVDADVLTIGRAADNDIALPDLSVDPHHARIQRAEGERITVIASGTLGFDVDGRRQTRCVINPAKGAEIAFGGHRITVTSDDGLAVLTVARVAALSDAAEERDEAAAFSLKGLLPGRRRSAWVLAITVLAVFLALPVWSYVQQSRADQRSIYANADASWSSGPLNKAHHKLETKCESCHVKAFVSVRDATCVACHKDAHDHAPAARMAGARAAPDFTGRFLEKVAATFGKPGPGACVDCHSEHEGAGPMPPTPQAFCADCHGTLKARLTDTKLGDTTDFARSHPQFRPLVPAGGGGLKFPHKLHLDPLSGVTRMAQTLRYGKALTCADCHTPTANGVRFRPVEMETSCQACHGFGGRSGRRHGDPAQVAADLRALYRFTSAPPPLAIPGIARQRPGDIAARTGSASGTAMRGGGACYDCHTVGPGGAQTGSVTPVNQPVRYLRHGWFDHAAHRKQTCTSCHAAPQSTRASDQLLPGIATCRKCHGGEGAVRPKVPSSCAMCHSYHIGPGAPWKSSLSSRPRAKEGG